MKNLLLALCFAFPLTACQDTTGAQGPPPKFSPFVQAVFEQYMEETRPILFVVSADGEAAQYYYCPDIADHCAYGSYSSLAIQKCEERSGGVPCHVYAIGKRIKWKG